MTNAGHENDGEYARNVLAASALPLDLPPGCHLDPSFTVCCCGGGCWDGVTPEDAFATLPPDQAGRCRIALARL